MARAPLVLPALAFLAAISAEAHGLLPPACVSAVVACAWRGGRIPAAWALAGALCALLRGHPPLILAETHTQRTAATVVGDVLRSDDGTVAPLALPDGRIVRAQLNAPVVPGERLVVRGRLVPFDEPRNPGEPSRRALALAEGLAGMLAGGHVVARDGVDPYDTRAWSARARAALSARLRAVLREPEATIVAGALWGERGTLPADLRDAFQATGTVHVLVTAGLHLGVVAACVLGLLRWSGVPRVAAALAAIPVVAGYAWLSGAHLPSERAAVMVCVGLLARACGARVASWNALALAAIVVAALWPASVGSVSFALSFSCVAAIVLFAEPLAGALARSALPARVREALALTIATQIGVWPLSAATFGLLVPYAVIANALVVPATALAMLCGGATLLFAATPILGPVVAALTALDVDAILRVTAGVAALPGAWIAVAPPPLAAIVGYDVAVLCAARLLFTHRRWAVALLVAASAAVLATTLRLPDGRLTITMVDVGQGDGIVVRTPRGHVILIDTGGRLERGPDVGGRSPAEIIGERIVLGYLRRQGIRHVDLLIETHPHGDHVGGCLSIVQALRVEAIGDSGQRYGGRAYRDCLAAARARRVPVLLVRRGMRYATPDGVVLDALAPEEPLLTDGPNDVNENSVVLRLTYRCSTCSSPFRMLFTGDAGAQSEARMLASGAELATDVLKVGHHGSAYSSTPAFLAAVHPRYALISVGRHNLFGHPAPSTLTALRTVGATVYRTDRCGAVVVEPRAEAVHVTTMIGCDSARR
ncbi:MAG TPA: DNA internalization-related competence protein ComEC/Rec2 [Candidatus Limnocylindria bacterium]|nr:DNA internalization-related competence protein ComEC/Rec2 [Candidatus Limnocylindria bacterium]